MRLLEVKKSTNPEKKLMAVFQTEKGTKKTTHFGAKGSSTYLDHKDKDKRAAYLARHKVNENWSDPTSAGALSRYILWGNSTSKSENIKTYKNKFNL